MKSTVVSLAEARQRRAPEERGLVHRIGDAGELVIDETDEHGEVVQSWEIDVNGTRALLVSLARQLVAWERRQGKGAPRR